MIFKKIIIIIIINFFKKKWGRRSRSRSRRKGKVKRSSLGSEVSFPFLVLKDIYIFGILFMEFSTFLAGGKIKNNTRHYSIYIGSSGKLRVFHFTTNFIFSLNTKNCIENRPNIWPFGRDFQWRFEQRTWMLVFS